jgi:hypothetical protein
MTTTITTLTLTLALATLITFCRTEFIAALVNSFDPLFGDVPRRDAEFG